MTCLHTPSPTPTSVPAPTSVLASISVPAPTSAVLHLDLRLSLHLHLDLQKSKVSKTGGTHKFNQSGLEVQTLVVSDKGPLRVCPIRVPKFYSKNCRVQGRNTFILTQKWCRKWHFLFFYKILAYLIIITESLALSHLTLFFEVYHHVKTKTDYFKKNT